MSQMIIRITDSINDVDVLLSDKKGNKFKSMSYKKLADLFIKRAIKEKNAYDKPILFSDPRILSRTQTSYLINQPEHQRIVTYSVTGKAYKINFPNALYIVNYIGNKIETIKAYAYSEYKGPETELFKMPMPNMLHGNYICLGNAPREIDGNIMQALENVIYTQYSHSNVNDAKGFKDTEEYFKFLENNKLDVKYMVPLKMKLKDIVEVL